MFEISFISFYFLTTLLYKRTFLVFTRTNCKCNILLMLKKFVFVCIFLSVVFHHVLLRDLLTEHKENYNCHLKKLNAYNKNSTNVNRPLFFKVLNWIFCRFRLYLFWRLLSFYHQVTIIKNKFDTSYTHSS